MSNHVSEQRYRFLTYYGAPIRINICNRRNSSKMRLSCNRLLHQNKLFSSRTRRAKRFFTESDRANLGRNVYNMLIKCPVEKSGITEPQVKLTPDVCGKTPSHRIVSFHTSFNITCSRPSSHGPLLAAHYYLITRTSSIETQRGVVPI